MLLNDRALACGALVSIAKCTEQACSLQQHNLRVFQEDIQTPVLVHQDWPPCFLMRDCACSRPFSWQYSKAAAG